MELALTDVDASTSLLLNVHPTEGRIPLRWWSFASLQAPPLGFRSVNRDVDPETLPIEPDRLELRTRNQTPSEPEEGGRQGSFFSPSRYRPPSKIVWTV